MSRLAKLLRLFTCSAVAIALAAGSPAVALAADPPSSPIPIRATGFEAADSWMPQLNALASDVVSPAYWGASSSSFRTGVRGLWCAATTNPGGTASSYWPIYPAKTRGTALLRVPETRDYYESTFSWWYTMPSIGADDWLNVYIYKLDASDNPVGGADRTDNALQTTAPWVQRTLVPTGRIPSALYFQFVDNDENGFGGVTGQGATIDDVSVTGYKYGPPMSLSAASISGGTRISWLKPRLSPASVDPDDRTLAYRVWRRVKGGSTWTELTISRTSATSFDDLAVAANTKYEYTVQAWDTGSGTGYGKLPTSVFFPPTVPSVSASVLSTYTGSATIAISATAGDHPVASVSYRLDGGTTVTVPGSTAQVKTSSLGAHSLAFWATDTKGGVSATTTRSFTVVAAPPGPVKSVRIAGANRFKVAVQLARSGFDPGGSRTWPGVTDVVVASGEDRASADPLAAAGLVWRYSAPLLLISSTGVDRDVTAVIDEIADRNGHVTIHVVGGTASVPDARLNDIKRLVGSSRVTTKRVLSGGGRFDLSAEIARKCAERTVPDTVLVANGADQAKFFDALALSAISANKGAPIVLVQQGAVPAASAKVIAELKAKNPSLAVVVGGGPATVSDAVLKQLGAQRWSGATRYATATEIANRSIGKGWLTAGTVGTAAKLPDALAGGAFVGHRGGVLMLTESTSLPRDTQRWLQANKAGVRYSYVFGGTASVSEGVKASVDAALR